MKIHLERRPRRFVTVDGEALLKVGASSVLAVDPDVLQSSVALLAKEPEDDGVQQTVAVVRIEGPLAQRAVDDLCAYVDGYDAVTARLGAALARKDAGAVLLVIDSPGGDVAGLEEAVARMRAMRETAGKPIVAYVDELAASAAYWIAAGVADEIHVPGAGRVGSIGCIGAWVDATKAWEQKGFAWHVVREPAGKAEMAAAAPVAELADKRLTESVRATGERFYAAMAAARGLDVKTVRGMDAALFTGSAAVEKKLADVVGTLEGAAGRALELAQERREKRRKDMQMKLVTMVAALCGLAAGASLEAVEEALETQSKDLLESTKAKTLGGAVAAFDKIKTERDAHAEKASKYDALEAEVAAKKLADEKAARAAKLSATIDQAVTDGKITPARKAEIAAKAEKHGQEWLEELVASLPVQGGTLEDAAKSGANTDHAPVTAELKTLLARQGLTDEDYRAAEAAGRV